MAGVEDNVVKFIMLPFIAWIISTFTSEAISIEPLLARGLGVPVRVIIEILEYW